MSEWPNIASHHVFVTRFSITVFKVLHILVESLILLHWIRSYVLKFIKMSVKDVNFKGHPAAHFTVDFYQRLNKFYIVCVLVVSQEPWNHRYKTVSRWFLHLSQFLGEFLALYNLLYLWSDVDTGVRVSLRQPRGKCLRYLKAADS